MQSRGALLLAYTHTHHILRESVTSARMDAGRAAHNMGGTRGLQPTAAARSPTHAGPQRKGSPYRPMTRAAAADAPRTPWGRHCVPAPLRPTNDEAAMDAQRRRASNRPQQHVPRQAGRKAGAGGGSGSAGASSPATTARHARKRRQTTASVAEPSGRPLATGPGHVAPRASRTRSCHVTPRRGQASTGGSAPQPMSGSACASCAIEPDADTVARFGTRWPAHSGTSYGGSVTSAPRMGATTSTGARNSVPKPKPPPDRAIELRWWSDRRGAQEDTRDRA